MCAVNPLFSFYVLSFLPPCLSFFFFFFNDTATTEIYTLSLHDALPICLHQHLGPGAEGALRRGASEGLGGRRAFPVLRLEATDHLARAPSDPVEIGRAHV